MMQMHPVFQNKVASLRSCNLDWATRLAVANTPMTLYSRQFTNPNYYVLLFVPDCPVWAQN